MQRHIAHYLTSFAILTVYGGQVCPFIEGLPVISLARNLAGAFALMYALRMLGARMIRLSAPEDMKVSLTFVMDLGLYLAAAFFLTLFNAIAYNFPFGSGLKMLTGFFTLGFFAATDTALRMEWDRGMEFARQGKVLSVGDGRIYPMAGRFAFLAVVIVQMVVVTLFLLINKDLEWLSQVGADDPRARFVVLGEMGLVGLVFLGHLINIIYSHKRNLELFFGLQNGIMASVAEGDLDVKVPISTRDEFGVMGEFTNHMIMELKAQAGEILRTRDVTILSLASLAETRDNETGAHILRTQNYVKALAVALKDHPSFSGELGTEAIELIYKSAPLHDIGKVGIPDSILLKPGKLTDEEFEIMKTHAALGREAIQRAEQAMESGESSFLRYANQIAYGHHEKWDGSGYPQGVAGEKIPVAARLMAVADVYDALISERVYKKAFSHETARDIIVKGRGAHFDPDVVDAFISIESEFVRIAAEYKDSVKETP